MLTCENSPEMGENHGTGCPRKRHAVPTFS